MGLQLWTGSRTREYRATRARNRRPRAARRPIFESLDERCLLSADVVIQWNQAVLAAHRLFGTTAAVWLVITAVCAECDARRGVRRPLVRFLVMLGVLVTAITAHLGGLLVHGRDFFT